MRQKYFTYADWADDVESIRVWCKRHRGIKEVNVNGQWMTNPYYKNRIDHKGAANFIKVWLRFNNIERKKQMTLSEMFKEQYLNEAFLEEMKKRTTLLDEINNAVWFGGTVAVPFSK